MSARFIKHGKLENPGGLAERESLSLLGKVIELSGAFSSTVELIAVESMDGEIGPSRHLTIFHTRWFPLSYVCWFLNHRNSIDISTINHSYWSYKPT